MIFMGSDGAAASPPGIAGLFDRVADTYDEVGVPWFTPIAQGLVDALDPQPGERALDVGCGKGAALLPLGRAVQPGGSALGVDLAPRMVAAAQAAVRAEALDGVAVRVGDAAAPPADGAPYDVVCASLVLFFLPDPSGALRAWTELLAPGGRLGVATFGANDPVWNEADAVFVPYLPQQMLDARTSGRRGPFASDAGVEHLLVAAGLSSVRTVTTTVDAALRDLEHWHEFSWSHGQRAMWEQVPATEREHVRQQAYGVLAPHRRADGSLLLSQQVRYTLGVGP